MYGSCYSATYSHFFRFEGTISFGGVSYMFFIWRNSRNARKHGIHKERDLLDNEKLKPCLLSAGTEN